MLKFLTAAFVAALFIGAPLSTADAQGGYCSRLRWMCIHKNELGQGGFGNCERFRHECGGGFGNGGFGGPRGGVVIQGGSGWGHQGGRYGGPGMHRGW